MRRCISSLYTGRAIAYRANKGFGADLIAISVGVQKMANSYTAGVMFTIHPANGDRSVIVIDSNFGFGESVVSGEVTPDHFVVNKITLDIIDRTISQKQICYTVDPKTQTSQVFEVPFERQKVQSLIDDEITELAWMGKQIEKHYGRPMDIEWALEQGFSRRRQHFHPAGAAGNSVERKEPARRRQPGRVGHGLHPVQPADREKSLLASDFNYNLY